MTATLEAPEVQDPIMSFVMPRPCIGQSVSWWPTGARQGIPETAFILKVGKRNVVIQKASGLCVESVRHIDDPKLALSADQREGGAWDFTDHDKQMAQFEPRLAALEARIKFLEELVDSPKKQKQ